MAEKPRDKQPDVFEQAAQDRVIGSADRRLSDLLVVYQDKTLILFGKPKKGSTVKKV